MQDFVPYKHFQYYYYTNQPQNRSKYGKTTAPTPKYVKPSIHEWQTAESHLPYHAGLAAASWARTAIYWTSRFEILLEHLSQYLQSIVPWWPWSFTPSQPLGLYQGNPVHPHRTSKSNHYLTNLHSTLIGSHWLLWYDTCPLPSQQSLHHPWPALPWFKNTPTHTTTKEKKKIPPWPAS